MSDLNRTEQIKALRSRAARPAGLSDSAKEKTEVSLPVRAMQAAQKCVSKA